MTAHTPTPSFDDLADTLPGCDPAELHGTLCGMLCAEPTLTGSAWLACVTEEATTSAEPAADERELLLALFEQTALEIDNDALGFTLILPGDYRALSERADALSHWCEGFLAGLGLGGLDRERMLIPEVEEFLVDLSEIARVGFDTTETNEDDEEAYAELIEYVRMGVLLIRQELQRPASLEPVYRH